MRKRKRNRRSVATQKLPYCPHAPNVALMRAARALLLAVRILGANKLRREAGLELGELALIVGLLIDEPALQTLRSQLGVA